MFVVTGGSGFVGAHLISVLAQRTPGTPIRSFDIRKPDMPHPSGVEVACGNLTDGRALRDAMDGARVVVHLAARVEPDANDPSQLWRVNVEGTEATYRAAVAARAELFIHMSSAGIYGPPTRGGPFSEDHPPAPTTVYQLSKWNAEKALSTCDRGTTTLNVLRPSGIYGPGSALELPWYRRVKRQRWALELRGGVVVHPTHVDDVVQALVALALSPAPHGAVFNVGGEQALRLQELAAVLADTLGVPRRRIELPPLVAAPIAYAARPVLRGRRTGAAPLVARARGQVFSAAVDDTRLRQRYPGIPVKPLEDGLTETVRWATQRGLL
jgi:nucleoside-diphosphate-sugar epimerase